MSTTSHTTSHILHLISRHQHVQDKLRDEITKAQTLASRDDVEITYDTLLGLPYLDAVCKETLRL